MSSYLKLLTQGNPKTIKGEKKGYLTFILHLAPADLSGFEVCQFRTKGCTAACLNLAGRGGMIAHGKRTNNIQRARKRRTKFFFTQRNEFMRVLSVDIARAIHYAAARGLTPVFRLNGTSDITWENIPVGQCENIFALFHWVQFYDYTKAPWSARRHDIPNYHLTFSLAETLANRRNALEYLSNNASVSAVFETKRNHALPTEYAGRPVINGDESDLRFLDAHGVYVGLRAKGYSKNLKRANGFVIPTSEVTK